MKVAAELQRDAAPLDFKEFFEPTPRELKPSKKLVGMSGKRVRLVGYMAHMEAPPTGAFYLCPHPVFCDEEGAGTADLPPESVKVIVRGAAGKILNFIPRQISVTGILQLGIRAEPDGEVTGIRLILDRPEDLAGHAAPPTSFRKHQATNR